MSAIIVTEFVHSQYKKVGKFALIAQAQIWVVHLFFHLFKYFASMQTSNSTHGLTQFFLKSLFTKIETSLIWNR